MKMNSFFNAHPKVTSIMNDLFILFKHWNIWWWETGTMGVILLYFCWNKARRRHFSTSNRYCSTKVKWICFIDMIIGFKLKNTCNIIPTWRTCMFFVFSHTFLFASRKAPPSPISFHQLHLYLTQVHHSFIDYLFEDVDCIFVFLLMVMVRKQDNRR